MAKNRGLAFKRKVSTTTKTVPYAPSWFRTVSAKYVKKPHSVSTRMLVEDEQGIRYAIAAVAPITVSRLGFLLPMGVSPFIPVYLHFVKAVNYKRYSVYACYNSKLKFPLFYIKDISGLGTLFKIKRRSE